jgi:hypothetical protein
MGGSGSGRRWYSKATTSDHYKLDVRQWQRDGLLMASRYFVYEWWTVEVCSSMHLRPNKVFLSHAYRNDEKWTVWLEWTSCNYGGPRTWFLCPGCGRRVAILYGTGPLACRQCHRLVYDSQQDSGWRRSINQARAARMKLGGSANLTEPLPQRPKGMHWRTYRRLFVKASLGEGAVMARVAGWLDKVEGCVKKSKTSGLVSSRSRCATAVQSKRPKGQSGESEISSTLP